MQLEFLNHASMLVRSGGISLLFDPWFEGTCFKGNWGLCSDNAHAYDRAKQATHLWVSHFHGDHFHPTTLRKLAAQAPRIVVVANDSANFQMAPSMRKFGFSKVLSLRERVWVSINDKVRVIRYPTSGIDNMLLVEAEGWRILNYNDCNLPFRALQRLKHHIGPIDVLLTNFNHAGKLIEYPLSDPATIILKGQQRFARTVEVLDPKIVIPFASHHYYRAREMQEQNRSLMEGNDLCGISNKILPLAIGNSVTLHRDEVHTIEVTCPDVKRNERTNREYQTSASQKELLDGASQFMRSLKHQYFGLLFWIPCLKILVKDMNQVLSLSPNRPPVLKAGGVGDAQIVAYSEALTEWFEGRFGTDTFFVGGTFKIVNCDVKAIQRYLLAGMLDENGFSPRTLMKILTSPSGFEFLANRREELWAIIRSSGLRVGFRS
jgi:L-ascorbate metabolism protein UlaG (beta-lactamase superfamily)